MAPIHFFFCGGGGGETPSAGWAGAAVASENRECANPLLFFFLGGGGPFQLDGRILDSPVRRSRARIGNAPIHFFFFSWGGGDPLSWMAPIHFLFLWGGGGDPFSWMGAFLILRCGVRERESGMRQSTSVFFSWGGGGDPFSWMGAFLILRCGVRERESGMRQSTSLFFLGGGGDPLSWMAPIHFFFCGGGGDPFSWMGAFLILRCGVRERESGMRQLTSVFFSWGGGGGPFQLDGRILDSPVRRSRARIGNAPIHFFVFSWGGGRPPQLDGANPLFVSVGGGGDPFSWMGAFLILRCGVRERESGMRQSTSSFFSWGGGRPPQLDGRILDSPVRRSRARIGNAPIHFFFFCGGGGVLFSHRLISRNIWLKAPFA